MKERDDNSKYFVTRHECNNRNSVLRQDINNLSYNKNKYDALVKSTRKLVISQENLTYLYRTSHGKNPNTITKIIEPKLVEFRIDKARYHGGDLEGTLIVWLFQNSDKIFKEFSK